MITLSVLTSTNVDDMSRNRDYIDLINTQRWRKVRAAVLEDHPWCEDCEAQGKVALATEVHHIVPLESIKDYGRMQRMAYDRDNLVALCAACHKGRHVALKSNSKEEKRKRDMKAVEDFAHRWYGETPGVVFSEGEGVR